MVSIENNINISKEQSSSPVNQRVSTEQGLSSQSQHKENTLGTYSQGQHYAGLKNSHQSTGSINKYLLIIARLESKFHNNDINIGDINSSIQELIERLSTATNRQWRMLQETPEYKALNIGNEDFKSAIINKLQNPKEQDPVFTLFKSKAFVSLLKGETPNGGIYQKHSNKATASIFNQRPSGRVWSNFNVLNSAYQLNV